MTEEKIWNVELPRGFHARLATADEITRGQRFAIAEAAAKAQSAMIKLSGLTMPRIEQMLEARSAEQVAVEFELYWRATVPSKEQKADLVKRSGGKAPYAELPKGERDEARATLEIVTRHAGLSDEDRAQAQELVDAIGAERAAMAEIAARDELSPQEQHDLFHHQAVRVFSFLRDWDLSDPLPTTAEECNSIPDTTFDALFEACREDNLPQLDTQKTARGLTDPKAPTDA